MKVFEIHVDEGEVEDLRRRLQSARLPGSILQTGSDDGAGRPLVERLVERWSDGFDWREQEARLNALPQFTTEIEGIRIHYIHLRGRGTDPVPLVMTHGWPGSFVEFEQILPLLTDPAAQGGDDRDAFDVVIPSLPGYGFSAAPIAEGVSSRQIADLWHRLMQSLGYDRYFAQGGDIGAGVSTWLAVQYPEALRGVHLNYVSSSFLPPLGDDRPPITPEEQAFLHRARKFAAEEGAYAAIQSTKPQTLAFALSDSPTGLAAWMGEKFASWTDHDGDLETVLPLDRLLTILSIYWFGNTLDASLRLYKENRLQPLDLGPFAPVPVPFAVALFPKELPVPPRSWVERALNVVRWTVMPRGGHFAALEQPELLAEDVRAAFRPLR